MFSPVFLFHFQEKMKASQTTINPVDYLVKAKTVFHVFCKKLFQSELNIVLNVCQLELTPATHTKVFGLFCNHNLSLNQKEQKLD